MIEKTLSFRELKLKEMSINSRELEKIFSDLEKINFFSEEDGKKDKHCKKVFSILRKEPNYGNPLNGEEYIMEEYLENGKLIKAKIYNFDLNVCSTCS
jgi:hypothetical protein